MSDVKPPENAEHISAFEVDELDDGALQEAGGGGGMPGTTPELNALADCSETNTNCSGGNCVAGCT